MLCSPLIKIIFVVTSIFFFKKILYSLISSLCVGPEGVAQLGGVALME